MNGKHGYYYDYENTLALCGHGYYSPGETRWLTRDPIGQSGGVNLYAYCQGRPVGNVDSSGLQVNIGPQQPDALVPDPAYKLAHPDSSPLTDPIQEMGVAAQMEFRMEAEASAVAEAEPIAEYTRAESMREGCSCPNPYGSKGSPLHTDPIAEIELSMSFQENERHDAGGSMPERLVFGTGRRPDLWYTNTQTGETTFFQVGQVTRGGIPIARELGAICDLAKSGLNPQIFFIPYNGPHLFP